MNLEDISNKHQKDLNKFFRNAKVIEYIYKEQFGEQDYNNKNYYKDGDKTVYNKYHDKFNEILDNTIFVPYITLDNLDDMLINAQETFGRVYLDLDKNSDKKEQLRQKIKSAVNDMREKNSSHILKELEQVFPNLPQEQYSTILKHCSNIEISALENILLDLDDDQYSKILQNSSNIDGNENTKYIDLDTLKQLLPNLDDNKYSQILKHCSDMTAKLITDKYFMNKNGFFSKKKKLKAEEIIEKNIKITDKKIIEEVDKINSEAVLLYGFNATMKRFSEEIKLSKRLNAQKKDIIKQYSSFMLDDLKQLFPELSVNECARLLKYCKNNSFEENANYIKKELFKDKNNILEENDNSIIKEKNNLFTRIKKHKVEKIIEKYKKLSDKKILMETSTFYKHFSEIPKGKYYTDILEKMSNSNISLAVPCIGKQADKNIRYIFLPILKYKDKENYIKTALHEIMHISKEQISEKNYKTGMNNTVLPKNKNASIETVPRTFWIAKLYEDI